MSNKKDKLINKKVLGAYWKAAHTNNKSNTEETKHCSLCTYLKTIKMPFIGDSDIIMLELILEALKKSRDKNEMVQTKNIKNAAYSLELLALSLKNRSLKKWEKEDVDRLHKII